MTCCESVCRANTKHRIFLYLVVNLPSCKERYLQSAKASLKTKLHTGTLRIRVKLYADLLIWVISRFRYTDLMSPCPCPCWACPVRGRIARWRCRAPGWGSRARPSARRRTATPRYRAKHWPSLPQMFTTRNAFLSTPRDLWTIIFVCNIYKLWGLVTKMLMFGDKMLCPFKFTASISRGHRLRMKFRYRYGTPKYSTEPRRGVGGGGAIGMADCQHKASDIPMAIGIREIYRKKYWEFNAALVNFMLFLLNFRKNFNISVSVLC